MRCCERVKGLFDHGGERRVGPAGGQAVSGWRLPAEPGWYYYSVRYPQDGAVGPFESYEAAERAASIGSDRNRQS